MSLAMSATNALLRLRAARRPTPEQRLAALSTRSYPEPAPAPAALLRRYTLTTTTIADRPVLRLTPRRGGDGSHLLYTHGGAYVNPLIAPHWQILDRATRGTGVTVSIPLYRLAPEGTVDAAYRLLQQLYCRLADEAGGSGITLAGDSAGGGLALGQALAYRDADLPQPRQIVLFSPWVDVTMSHPAVPAVQPEDHMLDADLLTAFARLWAGGADLLDPGLSPLHADLTDLPPVHVFQGGRDIFAPDVEMLGTRLRAQGNSGSFILEPGGFHVYVGAVWTPESRRALAAVRGLLSSPRPTSPA
jgi:acetyl esterase/lipase